MNKKSLVISGIIALCISGIADAKHKDRMMTIKNETGKIISNLRLKLVSKGGITNSLKFEDIAPGAQFKVALVVKGENEDGSKIRECAKVKKIRVDLLEKCTSKSHPLSEKGGRCKYHFDTARVKFEKAKAPHDIEIKIDDVDPAKHGGHTTKVEIDV
ncbi:hypothetical protein JW872_00075 [Candidatus Babeliales bacterium]|nr:hypothetical protein [Candidatus Babeliales bacterium]